jgi:hypothetical protein
MKIYLIFDPHKSDVWNSQVELIKKEFPGSRMELLKKELPGPEIIGLDPMASTLEELKNITRGNTSDNFIIFDCNYNYSSFTGWFLGVVGEVKTTPILVISDLQSRKKVKTFINKTKKASGYEGFYILEYTKFDEVPRYLHDIINRLQGGK